MNEELTLTLSCQSRADSFGLAPRRVMAQFAAALLPDQPVLTALGDDVNIPLAHACLEFRL